MNGCRTGAQFPEIDEVSRLVSAKLAAFLRTLRDNGFAVGLQEGRDAAALMAAVLHNVGTLAVMANAGRLLKFRER